MNRATGRFFSRAFALPDIAAIDKVGLKEIGTVEDKYANRREDRVAEFSMDRNLALKCNMKALEEESGVLYRLLRTEGKIWMVQGLLESADREFLPPQT